MHELANRAHADIGDGLIDHSAANVLPGPRPLTWDGPPRRVVVLGAHAGDPFAGFSFGIAGMIECGHHVEVRTFLDDPDDRPTIADALVRMAEAVGAGRRAVRHVSLGAAPEDLDERILDAVDGAELLVLPARAPDGAEGHARFARALPADLPGDPTVLRYVIPGEHAFLERSDVRRATVADPDGAVSYARLRLARLMGCAIPTGAPLEVASDLTLVPETIEADLLS